MAQLKSIDDYYRLGFSDLLQTRAGHQEVFRFIGEQLRNALSDPKFYFPFAVHLGDYATGEGEGEKRGSPELQREAIGLLRGSQGDLKRVLIRTDNEDTALAVLRGLLKGLPVMVAVDVDPAKTSLEMVDLWLILWRFLRQWQERWPTLVRLSVRGLYRWRSGHLAEGLAKGTTFEPFVATLREDEKEPFPAIGHLRSILSEYLSRPEAALVFCLQATPQDRYVDPELWKTLSSRIDEKSVADLLAARAKALPEGFFPPSEIEGILTMIRQAFSG